MSNTITLRKVTVEGSLVRYEYELAGRVKKAFRSTCSYEIDFLEDISTVPQSVLVIPFVTNVLPIVWIFDATLVLDEIDREFIQGIEGIKKGYIDMYPRLKFKGSITAKIEVDNSSVASKENSALLFSGGVDATSSLFTILKDGKSPLLITIWGADVALDDPEGWSEKSEHTRHISNMFSLNHSFVKSQFRIAIDESFLGGCVQKKAGDGWWHGFQHGIAIIGHVAPFAYKHGLSSVYIAASFTLGDNVTCASDPTIDNNVRMCGARTIHEGYSFTRQDKVANIHNYTKGLTGIDKLPILVCWRSRGGKNCGECEKCIRTACEFIAEGGDHNRYSLEAFNPAKAKITLVRDNFFLHTKHWDGIQKRLAENSESIIFTDSNDIRWVLDIDFNRVDKTLRKILKKTYIDSTLFVRKLVPLSAKRFIKDRLHR